MAAAVEEDSLSEGSAISDADDDADAEGSDGSDSSPPRADSKVDTTLNGHREHLSNSAPQSGSTPSKSPLATTVSDTEAMLKGLKVSGEVEDGGTNFEDLGKQSEGDPQQGITPSGPAEVFTADSVGERRRREHEEYKKKRDADPAFVPNRGVFFMHDHRSAAPGQNGFRPFGRGRGRGRGPVTGPYPSFRYAPIHIHLSNDASCSLVNRDSQSSGPVDAPWAHDLHETVTQSSMQTAADPGVSLDPSIQNRQNGRTSPAKSQPPNRSFSKTTMIGNVQIRVLLKGMTDAITFPAVPVNQHTRLPHHRPPLRRDKPVKISLPEMPIRYVFPSLERSFIFIPRAMRPNQQGFGRIRGRGSFGGGYSAFGGLSSRRTSAYAGSAYSPSVALSRRSSLAREVAVEGIIPPGATALPRPAPVVRLPPAAEQMQVTGQQPSTTMSMGPTGSLPQLSVYPLPQKPTFRENRPAALPMHHPKPERTLQVADIDSPATLEFNPPQQQQQLPFHQQVPTQITGQAYPPEVQYPHSRHPSHPSQASGGTPLPQIPERAIHALPFQPYPYQQPQGFYAPHFPPPVYFYPPPDQVGGAPSGAAPAFVPGQPYHYPIPLTSAPPPPAPPTEPTTQAGTVAHESNGMVYYYDSTQLPAPAETTTPYPAAGYAVPPPGGVMGIGGMMTPPIFYAPPPGYYQH